MDREKLLTVTGTGTVSVRPDTINVACSLSAQAEQYAACMQAAAEQTAVCRRALLNAGVPEENIKTDAFRVALHYRESRRPDGSYHNEADGYQASHTLQVRLPYDLNLLGSVLSALSECPAVPEFSVNFTVEKQAEAKAALLADAVRDARESAQAIADAAGLALGETVRIHYAPEALGFSSNTQYHLPRMMASKAAVPEIAPQDITLQEHVTVSWRIVPRGSYA